MVEWLSKAERKKWWKVPICARYDIELKQAYIYYNDKKRRKLVARNMSAGLLGFGAVDAATAGATLGIPTALGFLSSAATGAWTHAEANEAREKEMDLAAELERRGIAPEKHVRGGFWYFKHMGLRAIGNALGDMVGLAKDAWDLFRAVEGAAGERLPLLCDIR